MSDRSDWSGLSREAETVLMAFVFSEKPSARAPANTELGERVESGVLKSIAVL